MALPHRTTDEDRRLLYAIAEAIGIAGATEFPTEFPPSPHAPTHEVGGVDILTIDWSQLDNVPATFPPSAHAASHNAGGADPVTISELAFGVGVGPYFRTTANGVTGESANPVSTVRFDITGVTRLFMLTETPGVGGAGFIGFFPGVFPNAAVGSARQHGASDGNSMRIAYADGRNEEIQTAAFADEAQGVAETPRDYLIQEIFYLKDVISAIVTWATSEFTGPVLPFVYPADPYSAQSARPRNPPVGGLP